MLIANYYLPKMITLKRQSFQTNENGEVKLQARAVSRGVAIGRVVCLHGEKRQFYRIVLSQSQIKQELKRCRASVRLAKGQLRKIVSQKTGNISPTQAAIFETHLLILEDSSLLSKIETVIKQQLVNTEWAIKVVAEHYLSVYRDIDDEHLRERYIDFQDVTERLLCALGTSENSDVRLDENSVIVASEIKPSTLIELSRSNVKAIVAENGGWTSHTFILARELSMPALTGLKGILRQAQTGDIAIVDGFHGQLILRPKDETVKKYKAAAKQFQQVKIGNPDYPKGKLQTLDGRSIAICVNLDIAKDYKQAKQLGAQGIGLFRSEYLFNQNQGYPSESVQAEVYREIANLAGTDGVKVRTFDLTLEQIDETAEREKNPALGLRAIRLSLSHEKQFRTQIRALLKASFENNLDIVLPMISDVSEILETKQIIREEKAKLSRRKISFGDPKIGAMIEVPAAVWMADKIAREVDFLSLGTNDLVQYLLAADRDNASVADWFRTLHPAVLQAVKKVIEAAEKSGIPAIICGEMAGSPVYAAILIGLGATDLSMNIASIPRVWRVVSNIAFEEASEIVKGLENCKTAGEVEALVRTGFSAKWAHLFPPESLPSNN